MKDKLPTLDTNHLHTITGGATNWSPSWGRGNWNWGSSNWSNWNSGSSQNWANAWSGSQWAK